MPFSCSVPIDYPNFLPVSGLLLKYSRVDMGPEDFLKFGGAVAILLVGLYLIVISGGGVCPESEFPKIDLPCPTILQWANILLWVGFFGGLGSTCYYVGRATHWQSDVREASRSKREPRIVLNQEGSDLGQYDHYNSRKKFVGTSRLMLSWINKSRHSTFRCVRCCREFMAALNPEDDCWYWVQPHDGCELFPHENWELYLDNSSSSIRQGWDAAIAYEEQYIDTGPGPSPAQPLE